MNKTELIEVVAKAADLKKKDAEVAVNAVLTAFEDALVAGDKIQLIGFGTFDVKEKPAREGRNPATGETIKIPASKQVRFTAGKTLKNKVNA
ncbi:MAG: HU family DNA-binding protein [Clostridia bacterium]|jgi:DNA-binding protein HU-beta|nr:HU family DNA-binding protein [Clostridia bacterium]